MHGPPHLQAVQLLVDVLVVEEVDLRGTVVGGTSGPTNVGGFGIFICITTVEIGAIQVYYVLSLLVTVKSPRRPPLLLLLPHLISPYTFLFISFEARTCPETRS